MDYSSDDYLNDYLEEEDEPDIEDCCVECSREASYFCVCGNSLCYMHFEVQAGFCRQTPDPEHERLTEAAYGGAL